MSKDQLGVGNCPHCTKIIFKDAVFNSEGSFCMRCPHCDRLLKVIIKRKIEIIISPCGDCKKDSDCRPNKYLT